MKNEKLPICWKFKGILSFLEEFIVKLNEESATVTNYTGGEGTGSSWTDKVMSFKGQQESTPDEGEGAADDEWVGNYTVDQQY